MITDTEKDNELAIKALGIDWDDKDYIISTSRATGGALHFNVHIQEKLVECSEVEIQTIQVQGDWLILSGWVKSTT